MAAGTGAGVRDGGDEGQPADPLPHFAAHLLRAALAAPAVSDTQQWRFQYRAAGGAIEMYAAGPGRAPYIGCGAALFNLRLAAIQMGRVPVVRLLPRPRDPLLLATLQLGGAHRPTTSERELYAAILRRNTAGPPFASRAVPGTILAELTEAARIEGAVLHLLRPGGAQRVRQACGAGLRQPPARNLVPGLPEPQARTAGPDREPRVAMLATQFGARADCLRAGQALQRVLLVAAARGLSAQPLCRPHGVPGGWPVRDPRSGALHPHVILLLGYGPIIAPAPGLVSRGLFTKERAGAPAAQPNRESTHR